MSEEVAVDGQKPIKEIKAADPEGAPLAAGGAGAGRSRKRVKIHKQASDTESDPSDVDEPPLTEDQIAQVRAAVRRQRAKDRRRKNRMMRQLKNNIEETEAEDAGQPEGPPAPSAPFPGKRSWSEMATAALPGAAMLLGTMGVLMVGKDLPHPGGASITTVPGPRGA